MQVTQSFTILSRFLPLLIDNTQEYIFDAYNFYFVVSNFDFEPYLIQTHSYIKILILFVGKCVRSILRFTCLLHLIQNTFYSLYNTKLSTGTALSLKLLHTKVSLNLLGYAKLVVWSYLFSLLLTFDIQDNGKYGQNCFILLDYY